MKEGDGYFAGQRLRLVCRSLVLDFLPEYVVLDFFPERHAFCVLVRDLTQGIILI